MNAGELIHSLAERTGFDQSLMKELLEDPYLAKINLPDGFKTAVSNTLITMNEAKINPEIKKHFAGNLLGSVDAVINDMLDEYAMPDDIKTAVKSETSTFERVKLFTKSLAKLKEEMASAAGGDKAKLVQQINQLNADIAAAKDQLKSEVSKVSGEWQGKFSDHLVSSKFTGYDYAMENVPVDVQASSARILFERKLAEKGGKIKFEEGKLKLVSATDDSLPFTIDNKQVEFDSFADSVVAENKLIKVKGAPAVPPTPGNPAPPIHKVDTPVAPAAKGMVSKALEELRAGSA